MFDDTKYTKTDEFKNLNDLREWMKYNGHLWFYVNDRYYFFSGIRKCNAKGEYLMWWHIGRGDYLDISEEEMSKVLWEFWDIEDVWKAKVFDGKSFEENFDEFIFYD